MYVAYDIRYDTDGDETLAALLPKEIPIPDGIEDDAIADYVSDLTEFCVFGFRVKQV